MTETVLAIVAHPDDEVLGCGGTLARHANFGNKVHILICADGATSRTGASAEDVAHLFRAAQQAAEALGAEEPSFLGLPDNRIDGLDLLDVIQKIKSVVKAVRPDTVYTHHGGDLNRDHRIVHEAVITACRPLPESSVRRIYAFETVSSTEWSTPAIGDTFSPNRFVEIHEHLATKIAALEFYASEIRPFPHARSIKAIEAMATVRGAQAGLMAAEAFQCLLEVIPADNA